MAPSVYAGVANQFPTVADRLRQSQWLLRQQLKGEKNPIHRPQPKVDALG